MGSAYFEALARYWGRRLIGGGGSTARNRRAGRRAARRPGPPPHRLRPALAANWAPGPCSSRSWNGWPSRWKSAWQPAGGFGRPLSARCGRGRPAGAGLVRRPRIRGPFPDESRLSDLSRPDRDGIAAYLGEQMLMPRRTQKISEPWSRPCASVCSICCKARGRFLDEAGLQDFLIASPAQRPRPRTRRRRLPAHRPRTMGAAARPAASRKWNGRARAYRGRPARGRLHLGSGRARQRILGGAPGRAGAGDPRRRRAVLGAEEWPAHPAGQRARWRPPRRRARHVDASGLFLKREQYESFRLSSVSGLPAGELKARWPAAAGRGCSAHPVRERRQRAAPRPPAARALRSGRGRLLPGRRQGGPVGAADAVQPRRQDLAALERSVGKGIVAERGEAPLPESGQDAARQHPRPIWTARISTASRRKPARVHAAPAWSELDTDAL